VTGSEGERALVAEVVQAAGPAALASVGASLVELAALLARAEAVLAGDTGPLHLAAALGRPVVGIYGPTDPAETGPLSDWAAVVRRPVACGPCYDLRGPADCKLPDQATVCMRELAPEAVLAALFGVLGRHSPATGMGEPRAVGTAAERQ
jgi:ADP-heptose:LPS heptosyltransferase